MYRETSMQVRGPSFCSDLAKGNAKFAVEMSMNGQVMNKMVYADGKEARSPWANPKIWKV
ncbi:MAG: hypothetical protein R2778_02245 [Saprospiraceae bacterium]